MFELLVPPEKAQLERLGGDHAAFDRELRPRLTEQSITELQDAVIEPDVWKIEGLDSREDSVRVVAAARRGGRRDVGFIILGPVKTIARYASGSRRQPASRGSSAARCTDFWEALVAWRAKKATREGAVAAIAQRYRALEDIFESA